MMLKMERALRYTLFMAVVLVMCLASTGCPAKSTDLGGGPHETTQPAQEPTDTPAPVEPAPIEPPPEPEVIKFEPKIWILPSRPDTEIVLPQGTAFMIRVGELNGLIASVRSRWGDQVVYCYPTEDPRLWEGMGGVGRDQPPGEYRITIAIETTHGERFKTEKTFSVTEREYDSDTLTVAPSMARPTPEAQKRIKSDRKAFGWLWTHPSVGKRWGGDFVRPTDGRITSTFGEYRVFNGAVKSRHSGVDLAAPTGTPIRATASGRVVLVRRAFIEGNTVVVDHGGGFYSYYCHLSEFSVSEGDIVEAGDTVGLAGSTGRSTGPHLHWGCRVQGVKVDCLTLLDLNPWME